MSKLKVTDEQILSASQNTPSARQAALLLGIKYDTYRKHAIRLGCFKKNQAGKGYSKKSVKKLENIFNEHYFDIIDTSEKAYFVGFIAADGGIHRGKNMHTHKLSIKLHRRDREVLESLCYAMNYDVSHIVDFTEHYSYKNEDKECPVSEVYFNSKHLIYSLEKYDIVQNKSHIDTNLTRHIPKEFIMAWVVGYIDGDGHIGTDDYEVSIVSNYTTILSIKYFLDTNYDLVGARLRQIGDITYNLSYSRKHEIVKLLVAYMYAAPIHLSRKLRCAENLLHKYAFSKYFCNDSNKQNGTKRSCSKIKSIKKVNHCFDCGKIISDKAVRCKSCAVKFKEKDRLAIRPSRDELKDMIRNYSFLSIASWYDVSDNAIRKWCVAANLPCKSRQIKAYSDDEWEKI